MAKIKNIYGYGIGSQKYLVDKKVRLTKNDLRYNYTVQSQNFLNQLNINVNFQDKYLTLDKVENKQFLKEFSKLNKPWICFAVDSTEKNRIWPQKNFSLLADSLFEKKMEVRNNKYF